MISSVGRILLCLVIAGGITGCVAPVSLGSGNRTQAQWEYQHYFVASGAHFRYHPYGGQGRAWTTQMERLYQAHRRDPRVGYVVKNLRTGRYLAEFQADRLFMGGSMPKPMISAMLLEKRRGALSY